MLIASSSPWEQQVDVWVAFPALQAWTQVLIGTRGFILSICLFDVLFCCFVSSLMFFYVSFVNDLLLRLYNSERSFLYSFLGRV